MKFIPHGNKKLYRCGNINTRLTFNEKYCIVEIDVKCISYKLWVAVRNEYSSDLILYNILSDIIDHMNQLKNTMIGKCSERSHFEKRCTLWTFKLKIFDINKILIIFIILKNWISSVFS